MQRHGGRGTAGTARKGNWIRHKRSRGFLLRLAYGGQDGVTLLRAAATEGGQVGVILDQAIWRKMGNSVSSVSLRFEPIYGQTGKKGVMVS